MVDRCDSGDSLRKIQVLPEITGGAKHPRGFWWEQNASQADRGPTGNRKKKGADEGAPSAVRQKSKNRSR